VKQNVSGITAVLIIFVAFGVFFFAFSKLQAPPETPPFVPPQTPPVQQGDMEDMYKGLSPLGITVVVPPLVEDRGRAVRVSGVFVKSPAERAGLQMGDAIEQFDGKYLMSREALFSLLTRVDPKKTYPLVINRSGKELTLSVTGLVPLAPEERVRLGS